MEDPLASGRIPSFRLRTWNACSRMGGSSVDPLHLAARPRKVERFSRYFSQSDLVFLQEVGGAKQWSANSDTTVGLGICSRLSGPALMQEDS